MANRLEPINLIDYTGGLNLRASQFQLAENESPDMLNVDIDPRGGFYTRKGWQRWNETDIVDPGVDPWHPRHAFVHTWANGTQEVYVTNDHKLYSAGTDAVFAELTGLMGTAVPHCFDHAAWGDDVYIVGGMLETTYRRHLDDAPLALDPDNWSEIETPVHDVLPHAEYIATHASYMFVAVTTEADGNHFARVRWSHPGKPDSWRTDDYLDIEAGGGRITGIMPFRDHLLIFKTNSMWALYGYDEDSWQLIKVSLSVGCPSVTAVTRSESAVYFFSASDKGGIYIYTGEDPEHISENLRPAFEDILAYENVFVSWAARRLWVAVPWVKGIGATPDVSSCFVLDPDIGNGAWTMYRSDYGAIGPVVDGSDINSKYPLSGFWSDQAAIMVTLDVNEDAYDVLLEPLTLGYTPVPPPDLSGWLMTSADEELEMTGEGMSGQPFTAYYRTRWLHAGWPDRKKSWRRPTFICREVARDTDLLVETYRDYDEATVHRTRTLRVRAIGAAYWREGGFDDPEIGGFDWKELGKASPDGRGADWGTARAGANLLRSGSMGLARSVQMRVSASPLTPRQRWGVDGVVVKFVQRRFR
jgi:hypothetical protein